MADPDFASIPVDLRDRLVKARAERDEAAEALVKMTDRNGYTQRHREAGWRRLVNARLACIEAVMQIIAEV